MKTYFKFIILQVIFIVKSIFFFQIFFVKKKNKQKKIIQNSTDKIIYIILRSPPGAGLFSNVNHVISHIAYAKFRKFEYHIDFETNANLYSEDTEINGSKNFWDYYFKQTFKKKDLALKKNIIYSCQQNLDFFFDTQFKFIKSKRLFYYQRIIRENIFLNSDIQNQIDKIKNKLFKNKKNILGVYSRGTDYLITKSIKQGHQRQLSNSDLINKVDYYLQKENFEWVFITAESEEQITEFKNYFSYKAIIYPRHRIRNYDGHSYLPKIKKNRELDKYKTGLEYIIEMYLLASVDGFIGSLTNGSAFVIGLNDNKYKFKKII